MAPHWNFYFSSGQTAPAWTMSTTATTSTISYFYFHLNLSPSPLITTIIIWLHKASHLVEHLWSHHNFSIALTFDLFPRSLDSNIMCTTVFLWGPSVGRAFPKNQLFYFSIYPESPSLLPLLPPSFSCYNLLTSISKQNKGLIPSSHLVHQPHPSYDLRSLNSATFVA